MKVYHTSSVIVESPDTMHSRSFLDFGSGFYVTTLEKQAIDYAQRFIIRGRNAYINIYEMCDELCDLKVLSFDSYNEEWLEFIAASRHGMTPWEGYDLIEGGVANDKVVDAVEAYLSGLADVKHTLNKLAYAFPNNQICLLNQQLIDTCLSFVDCYPVIREGGTE